MHVFSIDKSQNTEFCESRLAAQERRRRPNLGWHRTRDGETRKCREGSAGNIELGFAFTNPVSSCHRASSMALNSRS